jgi:hypothetical protein
MHHRFGDHAQQLARFLGMRIQIEVPSAATPSRARVACETAFNMQRFPRALRFVFAAAEGVFAGLALRRAIHVAGSAPPMF